MRRTIARMASGVALVSFAKYYSPFGDGGVIVEALNVAVFTIVFLLVDRMISTKVR